ncbi:MAG TPA: hypothetical protein VH080_00900, partial [Gemmatimonadaceae bacterium]|nr:hypothetical protein [Gemmatimonadaceae bacterium]
MRRFLVIIGLLLPLGHAFAQPATSLADLRWSAAETKEGRFVVVPGEQAFVGGYSTPGLEVWTYPLQLVHGYWVSFRAEGDTSEIDGRSTLRSVEHTPIAATRVYTGPDFTVRERIFVPITRPAAAITYAVDSRKPILITVHFTPSLNLMWPGAVGGQEMRWDATHSAYTFDEPSRRFRGAIVSRQIVAHEQIQNNRRDAELERSIAFTMRAAPGPSGGATVAFAGASVPDENPLIVASNLMAQAGADEALAHDRYAGQSVIDVETPDSTVNRALRWAE